MNCKEVREELVAWLDGELVERRADELREHLNGCVACQKEAEQMQTAVQTTRRLPETLPAEDFSRRFFQRLSREQSTKGSFGWRLKMPRWALAGAGGLAAAVLGVAVFLARPVASEEDKMIASHLELFSDYEVIAMLPLLEDLEFIEALDEDE